MKIRQATTNDQATLLRLMSESHRQAGNDAPHEWAKTKTAITILLKDPQAGEAYFILDERNNAVGYMIMCRGFSLDYGGYFTWVEETYVRKAEQGRFRDQRFSP
ncbi:MAG: hypothetical protein JW953_14430 [Anaerolineae bacterium]|nr:hypothetical protein [Anaerolineae bacterium]